MQQDFKHTRLKDLEKIIEKEQDELFRFAYMRVGSREDAEDIVQDVFLKLYASEENLKHVRNIEHYLLRSISNCCQDYHRKKAFNMVPVEEAAQLADENEDHEIYEEFLRINNLLSTLSAEQSEIVRLKCYDGLKFREIAKILEIPEATAKSRYRYAIAHLQQVINN